MNSSTRTIGYLFVKNNLIVAIISFSFMSVAVFFSPDIISLKKVTLTMAASLIYSYVSLIFLRGGKGYTEWAWTISLPVVVYCSASSVRAAEGSPLDWMNWLFYFTAYFFLNCIFFRLLMRYRRNPRSLQ